MTREVIWNPDLMMIRASELGRLVGHLSAGQRDGPSIEGTTVAAPILLSLAAEDRSYCQKLCMGLSCGGAILAFSIHEFDASNDLGELI